MEDQHTAFEAHVAAGSFSSFCAYRTALAQTPQRLVERMKAVWNPEEELNEVKARSGADMNRRLQWYDVVALGVGGMLGAGIFVTTGTAANTYAGPAVILSYLIAGFSALLSALCYTEFAVEVPTAGGAFSYLRITFGEFGAFLTGANLLMEYVVSNAAVARSFTSYFAATFGVVNDDAWRLKVEGIGEGYYRLDFPALALIILITVCICCSTKNSSNFNVVMTFFHLALIIFIIVAGFAKGNFRNLTTPGKLSNSGGFSPYGARGVFRGAAVVYISYIGYDAVSTMAEEVKHPARNMPLGITGSVFIVTVLYCLMAAAITMLVPYDEIEPRAPFSSAFRKTAGWGWASNVVGVGASLGILSSLLVAMLGQARYMCVIGRSHLIPYWFAKVNSSTRTPLNSSMFLGFCTAVIALFTELHILVDLISIGTLFVFYMVANALIFRRYVTIGVTNPWPTVSFLAAFSVVSIGFVTFWQIRNGMWLGLAICGAVLLLLKGLFWALVPSVHEPKEWQSPLMSWIAAASIFFNVFLMGSLDHRAAYSRFGVWSGVVVIFYLAYSIHATYDAETKYSRKGEQAIALEVHPQSAKPGLANANNLVLEDSTTILRRI